MRHRWSWIPLALLTALPAAAGTLIVTEETTSASARQVTYWSDDHVLCRFDDDGVMLAEGEEFFIVSHVNRTVTRLPLNSSSTTEPTDSGVEIVRADEDETVGQWTARRYEIEAPMGEAAIEMQLWLATDLGIDDTLYRETLRSTALSTGQGWLAEVAELPGFPVRSETRIPIAGQVMESTNETVSIEAAPRPDDCTIPDGYSRTN